MVNVSPDVSHSVRGWNAVMTGVAGAVVLAEKRVSATTLDNASLPLDLRFLVLLVLC
jgi:hypothetical protein